ncbi:hypothetical protein LZZ90_07010 [Flavobacterium sp. SM15]|uniref:hypothetical protein n=1 Tax=Flavobacterium sp. SM15 TaxID=2908005 RepID=UPI001ED9FD50|nr:hypothetical protein [Flavobacterium sp. SM15]MCG2611251.1 hypothetical protein [Flavobacterium sp. SM15]
MLIKVVLYQQDKPISHHVLELQANEFSLPSFSEEYYKSFDLKYVIEFEKNIDSVIDFSYQWTSNFKWYTASRLQPKVLKLINGKYIQSNSTEGYWEVNAKRRKELIWSLNPKKSCVLAKYTGEVDNKEYEYVNLFNPQKKFSLLVSEKGGIIWSRSKIPFSGIACFSDHCDFDTRENLELQRSFFKENDIKMTKGFFLYNYSKRKENASFEKDSDELMKWIEDGHELAYHSLSQSIKEDKDKVFEEFDNFTAPLPNIHTWMDHGYLPYNLSSSEKNNRTLNLFFDKMNSQNVSVVWNYIDTGTTTRGVINQLNLRHFTLKAFCNGIKELSLKDRMAKGIKNSLFHFYSDRNYTASYKLFASVFKPILDKKKVFELKELIVSFFPVFFSLLRIVFRWNTLKNKVYPLAKYNSVFYSNMINGTRFTVFQTLEMVDLVSSLSKENLNKFCEEKGVFIAHTYFSVPFKYHKGRMFSTPTEINHQVRANFEHLGSLIREKKLWNPTIYELKEYFENIENLEFFSDESGEIKVRNNFGYHLNQVQ